jgi:hypothetical protein
MLFLSACASGAFALRKQRKKWLGPAFKPIWNFALGVFIRDWGFIGLDAFTFFSYWGRLFGLFVLYSAFIDER